MSMSHRLRNGALAVAALGALALGGAALADAASSGGSNSSGSSAAQQQQGYPAPSGGPQRDPTVPGGHRGANGKTGRRCPPTPPRR